jgi:hypothetical protein
MSDQRHSPVALYSREGPPVPTELEAGWASEPVWTQRPEEKSLACAEDRTPVALSVDGHYTDRATPDQNTDKTNIIT